MMILLRVLILLALAYLAWWTWRLFRPPTQSKATPEALEMIKCSVCGEHVPADQARRVEGKDYCSRHVPKS